MSQARVEPPLYLERLCDGSAGLRRAGGDGPGAGVAWANPSSLHGFGLAAADSLLNVAVQAVAASLGATNGLIFCSVAPKRPIWRCKALRRPCAVPPG